MKTHRPNVLRRVCLPIMLLGLFVLAAGPARAAGLDQKESEDLRQARQLYKSGNYQEAADIFSRLSSAHPDVPTFGRNAGAAYYYLKKPDPALSNLREYLRVQKNIQPDDRKEVEQWIAEMEQLRAQASAPAPAAAGTAAPAGTPPGAGTAPVDPAAAPAQPGVPAGALPPGYPPPGYYPYGVPPGQPQPGPGYPPGYGYPPPGAPASAPAPDATTGAAPMPVAPAGQPYPQAYPYGYAQPYPSQPAPPAPIAPVQEDAVQKASAPAKSAGPLPWIIGGAGVGALALGGVFTYLYRDAFDATRAQYDPDKESQGKTYSYLQFVCYGLGAAGVTTAAILLLKSDSGSGGTSVSVAPALGPQLAGAELMVRY